jgi:hypothetical protein
MEFKELKEQSSNPQLIQTLFDIATGSTSITTTTVNNEDGSQSIKVVETKNKPSESALLNLLDMLGENETTTNKLKRSKLINESEELTNELSKYL